MNTDNYLGNRLYTRRNPLQAARAFRNQRYGGNLYFREVIGWFSRHPDSNEVDIQVSRSQIRAFLWQWLEESLGKTTDRTQPETITPKIVNSVLDALEGISYDASGVR